MQGTKKYITEDEFVDMVLTLPLGKDISIGIEFFEDGREEYLIFYNSPFNGGTILFAGLYPEVAIIQDTFMGTAEELAHEIYRDNLVTEDGNKVFIKK